MTYVLEAGDGGGADRNRDDGREFCELSVSEVSEFWLSDDLKQRQVLQ